MVKIQYGHAVKMVKTDNGQEFVSKLMRDFFVSGTIIYQTSWTDTPHQNGRVKGKHRHIFNVVCALGF